MRSVFQERMLLRRTRIDRSRNNEVIRYPIEKTALDVSRRFPCSFLNFRSSYLPGYLRLECVDDGSFCAVDDGFASCLRFPFFCIFDWFNLTLRTPYRQGEEGRKNDDSFDFKGT